MMWGLTIGRVALVWMAALIPVHGPRRAASYFTIADAVEYACEDDIVCAAELVAIARYESDLSTWARGPQGEVGPWQLKYIRATMPIRDQAVEAKRRIQVSRSECGGLPDLDQLAMYTSGDCRYGRRESRNRLGLARALLEPTEEGP